MTTETTDPLATVMEAADALSEQGLAAARADAARYRAAWQEAERGLMRIVLRADTDPNNLTSGMLASDFRGSAMKSLSDARAALEPK